VLYIKHAVFRVQQQNSSFPCLYLTVNNLHKIGNWFMMSTMWTS